MHNTHKVGGYWRKIQGKEEQETCTHCNMTKSMDHILTQCDNRTINTIWRLAWELWPHNNIPWPEISLGTILGCGCIHLRTDNNPNEEQQQN